MTELLLLLLLFKAVLLFAELLLLLLFELWWLWWWLDEEAVKLVESVTWIFGAAVDLVKFLDVLGVDVDWPITGGAVFNWFDLERVRERTCEADGDCVSVCNCNGGGIRWEELMVAGLLLGIKWAVRDEVDDGAERGTGLK